MGLAHVPEGRHVFARMTVEENLRMGAYIIKDQKKISENLENVYSHFPRLKERSRQLAGTLSGGEQQMLATGLALMTDPKIVLMDEPSMGLSPLLVKEIFAIIEELHKSGITILLVEQNAKMALAVSDRAYVLETGTISMEGKASDLAAGLPGPGANELFPIPLLLTRPANPCGPALRHPARMPSHPWKSFRAPTPRPGRRTPRTPSPSSRPPIS